MSLFTKTQEAFASLKKQFTEDSTSAPNRLAVVTKIKADLIKLGVEVEKFRVKASETDPDKKIYGAAMVEKVLGFAAEFSGLLEEVTKTLTSLEIEHEAQKQLAEEETRKRKAMEQEQLELQKKQKMAEEEEKQRQQQQELVKLQQQREEELRIQQQQQQQAALQAQAEAEAKRIAEDQLKARQQAEEEARAIEEAKIKSMNEKMEAEKLASAPVFTIKIQSVGGKGVFSIDLPEAAQTTVLSLKNLIGALHPEFPVEKQLLIFGGKRLVDGNTLSSYNIKSGVVVHLGMQITQQQQQQKPQATPLLPEPPQALAPLPQQPQRQQPQPQPTASQVQDALVNQVIAALSEIKRNTRPDEFIEAVRTLVQLLGNALDNPTDAKYQRIRINNATLQNKLFRHPGGLNALAAIGFRPAEEGFYVLSFNSQQPSLRKLLTDALPPPSQPAASTTNPWLALSQQQQRQQQQPSANAGDVGGVGEMLNNPAFQSMMANPQAMLSNPAIQQMMSNPQMMQAAMQNLSGMVDHPMLAQFASNPALASQAMSMLQNPAMMSQAMSMMQQNPQVLNEAMRAMQNPQVAQQMASQLQSTPQPSAVGQPLAQGGVPKTDEEIEEELLAEAIRQSLLDNAPKQPPKQQDPDLD